MTNKNAQQIIESIKKNNIRSVLIVDDAYDPLLLSPEIKSILIKQLGTNTLDKYLDDGTNVTSEKKSLIQEIRSFSDYDSGAENKHFYNFYLSMYKKFLEGDKSDELVKIFDKIKDDKIEEIDPIIKLIEKVKPKVKVVKVGTEEDYYGGVEKSADLIFMDHKLFQTEYIESEENEPERRSIELLNKIIDSIVENDRSNSKKYPAVLLMSSKMLHTEIEKYLGDILGKINAVQFGFVCKDWFNKDGVAGNIDTPAVNAMTVLCESLEFGRSLKGALEAWEEATSDAVKEQKRLVSSMNILDFAYLKRYRLKKERVSVSNYLKWFLGESIQSLITEHKNWSNPHFENLENNELISSLKGAQPIHTLETLELYKRVRIINNLNRQHYSMGDVFVKKEDIRMIFSPECDLVPRKNGEGDENSKLKPKAPYMLSVGGKIINFTEKNAQINEIIVIDNKIRSIDWKLHDICSHKSCEDPSTISYIDPILNKAVNYEYKGTLRELYAKDIQTKVLSSLSRVGLSIPPVLHINAKITTYLKTDTSFFDELKNLQDTSISIILPEGENKDKCKVLFHENYVDTLIDQLGNYRNTNIYKNNQNFKNFLSDQDLKKKMLKKGFELSETSTYKTGVVLKRDKSKVEKSWLKFVIDLDDFKMN